MTITPLEKQRFTELQEKLRHCWQDRDILDEDDTDILVIPSFSIDQRVGKK